MYAKSVPPSGALFYALAGMSAPLKVRTEAAFGRAGMPGQVEKGRKGGGGARAGVPGQAKAA